MFFLFSFDAYYTESDPRGPKNGYDFKNIGPLYPTGPNPSLDIRVDSNQKFQTMKGFGAAISNAAAQLLYSKTSNRRQVLEHLFDPIKGAGISYIRLTMGGSDFQAVPAYTYDDVSDDFELRHFSIQKDRDFIIPLLKEILQINCNLKIMATPWSAPGWMKYNGGLFGGSFIDNDRYYQTYANYFVKFIQAYQSEGIQIDAITPQNEPEHSVSGYPTMSLRAHQEIKLVKEIGRRFRENNINTKIVIWDHNWDNIDYPLQVLGDAEARQYIDGTGFHCYAGNQNDVKRVKNAYPDKNLYFTECSGTDGTYDGGMVWNSQNIFTGQVLNSAISATLWNMALDPNHGPRVGVRGCQNCRGVLTINWDGSYQNNVEYQIIKHFAKYVKPGARRVSSSQLENKKIISVAFENPEGDIIVVVTNMWGEDRTGSSGGGRISVTINGRSYQIPRMVRGGVVTLVQRCREI